MEEYFTEGLPFRLRFSGLEEFDGIFLQESDLKKWDPHEVQYRFYKYLVKLRRKISNFLFYYTLKKK